MIGGFHVGCKEVPPWGGAREREVFSGMSTKEIVITAEPFLLKSGGGGRAAPPVTGRGSFIHPWQHHS